ncbi:MAG: hypothetical protein IIB76_05730 [Proteobacteria bacterium]|nr:hypothetical protein [Pseudomonadota bacterium]
MDSRLHWKSEVLNGNKRLRDAAVFTPSGQCDFPYGSGEPTGLIRTIGLRIAGLTRIA